MKFELWHAFVLGAIISWGSYVPVLHEGQRTLGDGNPGKGALRAFLCVGVAYFFTAVAIPALLMFFKVGAAGNEPFEFNARGGTFALLGGVAGAAGALCIILGMKFGGTPLFIPPLVFAGAPIVNALIGLAWHPPKFMPGPLFYTGIVLAAVGAGLVLYSKADLDARSRALKQATPTTEGVAAAAPAEH
jgi:hypothetical protein